MSATPESSISVRIALAGLGTVGQASLRLLLDHAPAFLHKHHVQLELVAILDRSHSSKDTSWIGEGVQLTDSVEEFLESPADVVVELIGGMEPAGRIVRSSLGEGKAVVTGNKLLMSYCGTELLELAHQFKTYLGFEAAVAGGIPIIRVIERSLFSDRIVRVRGILNGTCNYILSEMSDRGRDYGEALSQAQSLGYAESDPTLDVSGQDTADKLAILATLCFSTKVLPTDIPTRGITEISTVDFLYARRLNCAIKLLGRVDGDSEELKLRVSPFLINNHIPLSKISGVFNAVEVTGETLGAVVISGEGAGGGPTAVSVVADILNAALWKRIQSMGERLDESSLEQVTVVQRATTKPQVSLKKEKYPFYLRFIVRDRPGIISELADILARRRININSVLQEAWSDYSQLPFVITVEPTQFSMIEEAVEEMASLEFNCCPPLALPMLNG